METVVCPRLFMFVPIIHVPDYSKMGQMMNAKWQGAWNGRFRRVRAGMAVECGFQADTENDVKFWEVA
jgi:hypothetical protein